MVLVRHHLGDVLRRQRMRQGRTLRQVSADARVSLGYLSEIERGQKEASSELLSSVCVALDISLSDLLGQVSEELAVIETAERAAAAAVGPRPVLTSERIDTRRMETGHHHTSDPVASAA